MHLREWTHLACTWDATSGVKIYINGQVREHLSSTFPCVVATACQHCLKMVRHSQRDTADGSATRVPPGAKGTASVVLPMPFFSKTAPYLAVFFRRAAPGPVHRARAGL